MPATCSNERTDTHASVRVPMRRMRPSLRSHSEVFRSAPRDVSQVRRRRPKAAVGARDSIQGKRLVHHRLREEGRRVGRARAARRTRARQRTPRSDREGATPAGSSDNQQRRHKSDTTSLSPVDPASQRRARAEDAAETRLPPSCRLSRRASVEILRELVGDVRPTQREVDDGFEESELVARVVPHAFDLASVDRSGLQQFAEAVGQLNLTGAVAFGRGQRREDVGRQDVAADDGEIGRRVFARASRRDRVT